MTPNQPPSYTFLDLPSPLTRIIPNPLSTNDTITPTPNPSAATSADQTPTLLTHDPTILSSSPSLASASSHSPSPPTPPPLPPPTHPMMTRGKRGISKPLSRLNLHVTTESPLPKSHLHALRDPNWTIAMQDEFNALITNGTWKLVPRPQGGNIVRSMWLFRKKYKADGSLNRYKARLVANGRSQRPDIDCDETFSPVVNKVVKGDLGDA